MGEIWYNIKELSWTDILCGGLLILIVFSVPVCIGLTIYDYVTNGPAREQAAYLGYVKVTKCTTLTFDEYKSMKNEGVLPGVAKKENSDLATGVMIGTIMNSGRK